MTDRVLQLLRTRPDLAELAAFPFGFDVSRAYHVEAVHLASGAPLEPIAGDDTGGTYFLCGATAVLDASSEGDAVLLADSVGEALEILVRLPWWCENISAERPGLGGVRPGPSGAPQGRPRGSGAGAGAGTGGGQRRGHHAGRGGLPVAPPGARPADHGAASGADARRGRGG
ncbi:hypothetical protein ACWKT5_25075 [Streptomyces avermitilis]